MTNLKRLKDIFKGFKVPMNTVGSIFQRLPFDFVYSMISASGTKLSKFIPAPILVLVGPALSFRLGEQFKGISAKYDDFKGLMIRNATHLWETILASAAYRTGKMITRADKEVKTSGSLLGERWITDDGQIVLNMAMGKQMKQDKEKNIFSILLSGLLGVVFSLGAFVIIKYLKQTVAKTVETPTKQIEEQVVLKDQKQYEFFTEYIEPVVVESPDFEAERMLVLA